MSDEAAPLLLSEILDPVVKLAKRAGTAILEDKARTSAISFKADESPLTSADLASHRLILAGLTEAWPNIPVLSEESRAISFQERSSWRRYFLVDPLDGTKEFIKGKKEYTVNIALIEDGVPVLGVVYVPELSVSYFGAQGVGAFKEHDGEERKAISVAKKSNEILRVVGSSSHASPEMGAFLELVGPHQLLQFGSSLKICQVADGTCDFYPRFGPTSEWDTAAGHAVVLAAGGRVVVLDGSELVYNQKDSLLNPSFFVLGPMDRDLLAYCRDALSTH